MLTPKQEIAKQLGVSVKAVKRIAKHCNLKYEKVNGKQCYNMDDILEAISRGKEIN